MINFEITRDSTLKEMDKSRNKNLTESLISPNDKQADKQPSLSNNAPKPRKNEHGQNPKNPLDGDLVLIFPHRQCYEV